MDHSLLLPGLTLVAAAAALLSMVAGFDSSALASSGEVGGGFRIRKLEVGGKSGETIIDVGQELLLMQNQEEVLP